MRRSHNVCKLVVFKVILAIGVVTGMQLLSGCGFLTVEKQTVTYRVPNWMPDGRIVALKQVIITKDNPILGPQTGGTQQWIVVMNEDGSGEGELFKVDEQSIELIEVSPQGNYLGYVNGNDVLKVFQNTNGWGLFREYQLNLSIAERISIHQDEDLWFVINSNTSQFINILTNEIREFGLGRFGVWMNENEFYYTDSINGSSIYNYSTESSRIENLGIFPYDRTISAQFLLDDRGDQILKYNLDTSSLTTIPLDTMKYDYNQYTGRHFSPDGNKLVMMFSGSLEPAGIFILNIQTSDVQRIH